MNVEFPKAEDLGPRDWGSETLLGLVSGKFMLKQLKISAGAKGGLQYHREKDEIAILLSGELIVRFDNGSGHLDVRHLQPGDVVHFPPGAVHQEEALTDCVILEASTPHFNDRVRVEDRYGLKAKGGLPTTLPEDIVER